MPGGTDERSISLGACSARRAGGTVEHREYSMVRDTISNTPRAHIQPHTETARWPCDICLSLPGLLFRIAFGVLYGLSYLLLAGSLVDAYGYIVKGSIGSFDERGAALLRHLRI